MAKIRRRGYPAEPTEEQRDPKYGRTGHARGKDTSHRTGGHGDLPNKPRRDR